MDLIQPSTTSGVTIYVYDGSGGLLGSGTSPLSFQEFWGVYSDTPIGQLVFIADNPNAGELVGNVAYGSIQSTPVSNWAIILGALLIVVFTFISLRSRTNGI